MLHIFHLHVYALLDPGASLSFVTPYIAVDFGISPKILVELFLFSTQVVKTIIARRVYRHCPVMIFQKATSADLVELEITDFDVIPAMPQSTTEPGSESPSLESVPVINEYSDMFPKDIPRISPEREIDFDIRSFLGLAGYYRCFVEGFSSIASPMSSLTQKKVKFKWSDPCEKSFQELKTRLTSALVLALPDISDRKDLEFEVDDYVYLKISPMKEVKKFSKKRKLSPYYVGPFRILTCLGKVAYELELPSDLASFHPVFYVSFLKSA
ncbi:putative zinc finger protein VAR3, chloroplastic-like [Capsicum annuum]|nr:putative zinc finger protein VAR3, chloroplastic-like [Capsicum annuum]KAF3668606.1 putative zinc finger protein VAR3, chloroplastic-like [Capsicum annuum]